MCRKKALRSKAHPVLFVMFGQCTTVARSRLSSGNDPDLHLFVLGSINRKTVLVIPAQAGIAPQHLQCLLDSRMRGNDVRVWQSDST
jgi:hypothetical protein